MEAAAVAVDYASREWSRLAVMDNPAGYLYRCRSQLQGFGDVATLSAKRIGKRSNDA
jgi:hypothetical protein